MCKAYFIDSDKRVSGDTSFLVFEEDKLVSIVYWNLASGCVSLTMQQTGSSMKLKAEKYLDSSESTTSKSTGNTTEMKELMSCAIL